MKLQKNLILAASFFAFIFVSQSIYSQEAPTIKFFDQNTTDEVKLDYDNDGDLDFIIAGVISDKHQGRVYIVENKGTKFGKPEYIYSFPTIPIKQKLNVRHENNTTTINTFGTSPSGEQKEYIGTLIKGQFEGLILAPVRLDARIK